jgi:erythromycin esterase
MDRPQAMNGNGLHSSWLVRALQTSVAVIIALNGSATRAHPQSATGSGIFSALQSYIIPLAAPGAPTCNDLERLRPTIAKARVIALGELIHDAHELHLLRNRFVRCLTSRFGVTAIALESGFGDMAPLENALLRPGRSVVEPTRRAISYGWGGLPEVQALTETLRAYNARHPRSRRVGIYGIDLTGADGSGRFSRAGRSIEWLTRYLATLESAEAHRLGMELAPLSSRFSEAEYPRMSAPARDSIRQLLAAAERLVQQAPKAQRFVAAAQQSMAYFELLESLGPTPRENPGFWRLLQMRDSVMADNLIWALDQEGDTGRILLLAHNAHVFDEPLSATLGRPLAQTPFMLGQRLRGELSDRYIIVGTEARTLGYYLEKQVASDSASLGSILSHAGAPWFMVDLRAAKENPALSDWLRQPSFIRFNWGYQRIRPGRAADFIIYGDSLSPTGGELP